jgi:NADH dehydrogenase
VRRFLLARGVRLETNARAVRVEPRRVHVADGRSFEGFTLIWTAGVRVPPLVADLPLSRHVDGRIHVNEHLHPSGADGSARTDVFVIGDCAASPRPGGGMQPQLSQTAIAMGTHVGETLVREARGLPPTPFRFRDAGYIISLGQHSSVLEIFGVPLSGRLAWLGWAAAYLVKMVGLRKQIEVGLDHLTHLFFQHDTSQILARRVVLTDDELDLVLGGPESAGDGGSTRD